jgi:hypothetical protein
VTKLHEELDVLYKEQKAIEDDEVTSKEADYLTKRIS